MWNAHIAVFEENLILYYLHKQNEDMHLSFL